MSCKIFFVIAAVSILCRNCYGKPAPDSAGIVPLPGNGIAYGGIPYGSVSGQLSLYYGESNTIEYDPFFLAASKEATDEIQLL